MRFLSIALIASSLLITSSLQSQTFAQPYQPTGRLIDVGGRKLHLDCQGKGSPTVILESGGDAYSIDWSLVQPHVAQQTRVCSYDRAGLGWSDSGPADETVEQTVSDLHALLAAGKEKPPYILVGASVGGAFIQAYQYAFPREVAALVFSNSSNHIGISVKGKIGLIWNLTEDEIRSAYPLPASAKGAEPTQEGQPFDRLPPQIRSARLQLDQEHWKQFNPATTGPGEILSWHNEFLREFNIAKGGGSPVLGKLPVIVISSNPVLEKSECLSQSNAAACLDYLSANTVHITASGSGHEIHLYEPDVVIKAILKTLSSVQNSTPLTGLGPLQ